MLKHPSKHERERLLENKSTPRTDNHDNYNCRYILWKRDKHSKSKNTTSNPRHRYQVDKAVNKIDNREVTWYHFTDFQWIHTNMKAYDDTKSDLKTPESYRKPLQSFRSLPKNSDLCSSKEKSQQKSEALMELQTKSRAILNKRDVNTLTCSWQSALSWYSDASDRNTYRSTERLWSSSLPVLRRKQTKGHFMSTTYSRTANSNSLPTRTKTNLPWIWPYLLPANSP